MNPGASSQHQMMTSAARSISDKNETRIAFWAESREEVDRIAEIARAAGAKNIEGPELYEEPGYYAVFFEDPDGNKLEVCHRAV